MTQTLLEQPTNLVVTEPVQPLAVVEASPLTVIQRLAESGADPNTWMALIREWEDRIAAEKFGQALAKFQAKCPQIQKLRTVDFGGGKGPLYASLDDIMAVVKPIAAECELAVTFSAGMTDDGKLTAKCIVRHGRHSETSEITLPVPSQMRVNDTQKMGAALSYAKRYALCAALNIVVSDEDRDGVNLASTISDEQLATLAEWVEMLQPTSFKLHPFLKWLGIEKLQDLHATNYDKALNELRMKAHQLGVAK